MESCKILERKIKNRVEDLVSFLKEEDVNLISNNFCTINKSSITETEQNIIISGDASTDLEIIKNYKMKINKFGLIDFDIDDDIGVINLHYINEEEEEELIWG